MIKRPLSVTILSWLLIAAGTIGFVYHAREFNSANPFQFDILGVELIRLLAIVSGIFMLRGANWARWLALLWIAFHTVVSIFHTPAEVAMHGVLLAVFAYFLFRSAARTYFSGERTEAGVR